MEKKCQCLDLCKAKRNQAIDSLKAEAHAQTDKHYISEMIIHWNLSKLNPE